MLSTHNKKRTGISVAFIVAIMTLSATGCSTTHEIKPTASVMIGAHKSL